MKLNKDFRVPLKILSANAATIYNALNFSFSGLDLRKINIEGAMLQQSYLVKSDLTKANLKSVCFYDANMDESIINSANFEKVKLGKPKELIFHKKAVRCVAFSSNDLLIAAGSSDGSISVWKVSSGEKVFVLEGHEGAVVSVDFSP